MPPAIQVQNLSKRYRISHEGVSGGAGGGHGKYKTLRDTLTDLAAAPFRRLKNKGESSASADSQEDFFALKDVSFDVQPGEVVGIIGRNGAGKSTLLKILSRITKPSSGKVTLNGRVGSLLEVGTGFHPELTGRENIFLNGSILGMQRSEITKQFDAIVDFSGVEKFLDTPVKRYSSGMYVRLAFAVAAFLNPEILIIDEVLAVGDASFQKKCLQRMSDVAEEGRTVMFVSHQMNAIRRLCRKLLFLSGGEIITFSEDVESVVGTYLAAATDDASPAGWENRTDQFIGRSFQPTRFALSNGNGKALPGIMRNDQDVWVIIEGVARELDIALNVGYAVYNDSNDLIYWTTTTDLKQGQWPQFRKGKMTVGSQIPKHLLNEGTYRLELIVSLHHREWICRPSVNAPAISLSVRGGLSESPYWMERRPGILAPVLQWKSISNNEAGNSWEL